MTPNIKAGINVHIIAVNPNTGLEYVTNLGNDSIASNIVSIIDIKVIGL